ncbi:Ribonucleoside-diphosphate reductase NrdZ [compost metagenome]
MLWTKMVRGKGYFTFIDKMNRHLAEAFKRLGLKVEASNLCQETVLPSNDFYTFSCVILNYNLELYRQWPERLVFIGQVMSDCNISEYLATMDELSVQDRRALKKIYRFTKHFRALGSGVLGFHTLLQRERMSVSSMEAMFLNTKIFKGMKEQAEAATGWLAGVLGEPKGCKGLNRRNATTMMMPPTKSTAELMAGASEGIGLDVAMAFTKQSAGGEFFRVNKVLLEIIKEKGLDFDTCVKEIIEANGSVQKVDWLDDHLKAVFRTAFEIPMEDHLRLCSQRQKYIDQGQSINLYFTSNDSEEYISYIHRLAMEDENILSLYYIYSMRGSGDISRVEFCEMCQ